MGYNESDTRAKLIDPALHARGWTEDLIKREETAGAIEIVGGKARRRARGRVDYTLRIKVHLDTHFARFRKDGSVLGGFDSIYIVTKLDGKWGIQGRSSYAP